MNNRRPIAFVSDENYSALADVSLELQLASGECAAVVRSSPRGAVYADIPAGNYTVTLCKPGFGSKRTTVELSTDAPHHFRLLSDTLYGYAWPKWVRAGDAAEHRVHCAEPYHLSLWRYGAEKLLVRNIGWFDEHAPRPNLQILPDGDFTQTGVDWNRHGYRAAAYRATAPDRSGLYYFHARTASGAFFGSPWVVAPAKPTAPVAVLASTNTWNAYNNFGGRSNYTNSTGLPPTPTVNSRLDLRRYTGEIYCEWSNRNDEYLPLSFDRPEPANSIADGVQPADPIRGRHGCHLAEAEWRLLAWMEREGFAYDLYSEHQLHVGELDLDAYRALVISTHPEYWSREAYVRVRDWVYQCGGRFVYLGGNGIDCEVEFLQDNARPLAMRCNTWQPRPPDSTVFTDPDTKKQYDCRFHYTVQSSPAELTGVVFSEAGNQTSAPFRATADASHWILAGTGLKNGDVFGTRSLHERCPHGASGHETDKRTANSPKNATVLARGMNDDDGGAEMVFFETPRNGAVFSVGSITWPACVMVDPHVSRITRNVLERFVKE